VNRVLPGLLFAGALLAAAAAPARHAAGTGGGHGRRIGEAGA
jgi:hypothetical protein